MVLAYIRSLVQLFLQGRFNVAPAGGHHLRGSRGDWNRELTPLRGSFFNCSEG